MEAPRITENDSLGLKNKGETIIIVDDDCNITSSNGVVEAPPSQQMSSSSTEDNVTSSVQQPEKNCLVCGDKALGYNFNAVSCESCKAFFRRNAHQVIRGRCQGQCDVTVESRSFCKKCRLAKCFTVGMRKDMILNKEQKEQRRQKIIVNKLKKKKQIDIEDIYSLSERDRLYPLSATCPPPPKKKAGDAKGRTKHTADAQSSHLSKTPSASSLCTQTPLTVVSGMTIKQEALSPSSDFITSPHTPQNDTKSNSPWTAYDRDQVESSVQLLEAEDQRVVREVLHAMDITSFLTASSSSITAIPNTPEEFVNVAENFVRKMIRLGKNISYFKSIKKEDQVALLKCSVVDTMMLRSAVNYDPFTESWSLNTRDCLSKGSGKAEGERLSAQILANGSAETRRLFLNYAKFIRALMSTIHGDLLVLKLLIMLSLFSADRLPLINHDEVQKIQENYGRILEAYVNIRFNKEATLFARIISKLTDLRNINEIHSNMLMSMKMEDLEPLLLEIFDIPGMPLGATTESGDKAASSFSSPAKAIVVTAEKQYSKSPDSSTPSVN